MESVSQDSGEVEGVSAAADIVQSLAEDETIDFVTGKPVKLKGNEEVRQRIARGLYYEYGIRVEDMERDFPIQLSATGQVARPRRPTSHVRARH